MFTIEKRSDVMRQIRSKNTKPEVALRSALHREGFRFRLHVKGLPGRPDIVLPKWKIAIQVRGCFWHSHVCHDGHLPKSNQLYWKTKLARNQERDKEVDKQLRACGWKVMVVWECELQNQQRVSEVVEAVKSQAGMKSDTQISYERIPKQKKP